MGTRTRMGVGAVLTAVLALTIVAAAPAPTSALLTKRYVQVAGGYRHSCAVASDGTAICWGNGAFGQLGDGSTIPGIEGATAPRQVRQAGTPLSGKTITQVAAGSYFTCAVASGRAYCWGRGDNGQLGDGRDTTSALPVAVTTSGTPLQGKTISVVTTGAAHACALATDGTVGCWGDNVHGQVGDGSQVDRLVPVAPRTSGTGLSGRTVQTITAGAGRTCASTTDGNLVCWGDNGGAFGDGGVADSLTAKVIPRTGPIAGRSILRVISASDDRRTCVLTTDRILACTGEGSNGKLGNGASSDSTSYVAVRTAATALAGKQIVGFNLHSRGGCARASDNAVACWGNNYWGDLGAGSTAVSSAVPVALKIAGTAFNGTSIVGLGGGYTPCAVAADGRVGCWGEEYNGSFGDGGTSSGASNVAVGVLGTGPFAPFASFGALVAQQFRDLVGRAPTSAESATWVGRLQAGQTAGDLIAALRASNENATNVDPVARLYWAYFGRIPDRDGLVYWVAQKRAGRSLSSISRAFVVSPEFRTTYGSLTNTQFVNLVYTNVLGRPGSAGDLAYWVGELNSGRRTRESVMTGFSESPEYRTKMANPVTVVVLYTSMLRRSPTTAELTTNVNRLVAGTTVAQLAQQIATSGPYLARFPA